MSREEMIRKIWREEYMTEPRRTIDDLVWHLDDSHIASPGIKEAIIAALRAGQAMRDSIGVTKHVKRDGSAIFREAHVDDSLLAIQGIESWDAAVGGEK